ncbi:hypothetical protein ACWEQC_23200 [Streptomyces shenzhenensis]
MTGGRKVRVGRLGLWGAVWGIRRVLLLSDPILGPYGRGRPGSYYHVCEHRDCTADVFLSTSSDGKTCYAGHPTVAAAVLQSTPRPARASGSLYIHACLDCMGPPTRLPEAEAPECDRHRPPRTMTLLAKP